MTEKSISISKRDGLVYKTSRWIGGLFSDKPKPPPLVRKQPIFTLSEDFRRIPEMIAMIGNNSDKSASIGVEAWGKKVENQTFVILKLSMFGMRMDGRFECVTLRTKFTDDKGDHIFIPHFFPDKQDLVNPTSMTKSAGTSVNAGINLGWQNIGIQLGFEKHSGRTISMEAYDMTARGGHDPDYPDGIKWELEEGEKCGLVTYTCGVRFDMPPEVNAEFRLYCAFKGRKFRHERSVPNVDKEFMKVKFRLA